MRYLGPASFVCTKPCNRYFRLCGPPHLLPNMHLRSPGAEASESACGWMGVAVDPFWPSFMDTNIWIMPHFHVPKHSSSDCFLPCGSVKCNPCCEPHKTWGTLTFADPWDKGLGGIHVELSYLWVGHFIDLSWKTKVMILRSLKNQIIELLCC